MDDRMLQEYRREPDPRFARELRERLRRQERPRLLPASPAFRLVATAVVATAAVVVVFAVPSVRVSAESILDIFRVKRFAVVEFKESRREILAAMEKDRLMVFDREETLLDPGPARPVASRAAAGAEVGFPVVAPGHLPAGLAADSIFLQGEGAVRFAASEAKLRTLLDKLDLRDVKIPAGLDGQWVEVRKPAVVVQRFRAEKRRAILLQARSPEVSMPAGWDLERLGEIGLRILGLDAGEAKRIAHATDWRSTLLLPIPANASTFRQVTVRGQQGILITTTSAPAGDGRRNRMVLWSENGRVFCLEGNLRDREMIQMAESIS
jgi:hypothetical protein